MRPYSSSPQWLCSNMPAMEGQWRSSRIISVRTNRVLNKHQARSLNTSIKTEIGPWHTECSTSTKPLWWWGGWTHSIVFMTDDCVHIHIYHTYMYIHIYVHIYIHNFECVCDLWQVKDYWYLVFQKRLDIFIWIQLNFMMWSYWVEVQFGVSKCT